jgi:hypothetical protein
VNGKSKLLFSGCCPVAPKKKNYDASNPVESSGIVGKNFPFDLGPSIALNREIALSSPMLSLLQLFPPFHEGSLFQTFQPFQ